VRHELVRPHKLFRCSWKKQQYGDNGADAKESSAKNGIAQQFRHKFVFWVG
jgi:hypothetical protein